jgi:chemotaxis protein CheD
MSFQQIQVLGGETFATAEDNIVFKTVLGPCVSACLFDPVLKIGGMNHFLLPTGGKVQPYGRDRFGDVAMQTLLNDLISLGGNPWRMQARLFGGKSAFLHNKDIGAENARAAKRFLIDNGIRLVESDLGGNMARWVTFNPTTGSTSLKRQVVAPKPDNENAYAVTMRR